MTATTINIAPRRVTDLIALKEEGLDVAFETSFNILPVNFDHRENPFKAFIFLCTFSGHIDDRAFSFRKCYARGCPHNLCPHVAQAVMIANRYLQRDYARLKQSGFEVTGKLFTLDEMVVKFEESAKAQGPGKTIYDYIDMARQGHPVQIDIDMEYVPAVEHFAGHDNAQTFLTVNFKVTCTGATCHTERCLACFPTDDRKQEKPQMVQVANERLGLLYRQFDAAGIDYQQRYFE
jgi:hypothetical protein